MANDKKDAYYFPHDCNAKDDPKCMLLIDQLGLEGYGIYWILIETLRNQPDYKCPISMIPALARRYNTSGEKMLVAVKSFGLFTIKNETIFFSQSLSSRMIKIDNRRKVLSDAGLSGNKVRWRSPGDPKAIAINQIKSNQIKEKEIIVDNTDLKKYRIEDCLRISLADPRWVKANHATEPEVLNFNNYLEKIGKYDLNPIDYKKYFATIKGKYPELLKRKYSIEELRLMAIEQDKILVNGKHSI